MCIVCINHIHFTRIGRLKKLARTSCWYVPGRVVRMSSALLEGPFENKQMCHSSSRHLLYFIISCICLGCLDQTSFTMTKVCRTSCWYVPEHAVRISSAILGQMKDILIISRCVIAALDILNTW